MIAIERQASNRRYWQASNHSVHKVCKYVYKVPCSRPSLMIKLRELICSMMLKRVFAAPSAWPRMLPSSATCDGKY